MANDVQDVWIQRHFGVHFSTGGSCGRCSRRVRHTPRAPWWRAARRRSSCPRSIPTSGRGSTTLDAPSTPSSAPRAGGGGGARRRRRARTAIVAPEAGLGATSVARNGRALRPARPETAEGGSRASRQSGPPRSAARPRTGAASARLPPMAPRAYTEFAPPSSRPRLLRRRGAPAARLPTAPGAIRKAISRAIIRLARSAGQVRFAIVYIPAVPPGDPRDGAPRRWSARDSSGSRGPSSTPRCPTALRRGRQQGGRPTSSILLPIFRADARAPALTTSATGIGPPRGHALAAAETARGGSPIRAAPWRGASPL